MDSNDCISHESGDRNVLGGDATPSPVGDGPGQGEPSRRTALECLNAELAILDRPLEENGVEVYDEPPLASRWRRAGATLGLFMLLAGATSFGLARWSTPAIANEAAPSAPVAVAAPPTAAPRPAAPSPAGSPPAAPAVAGHGPRHHHHHHHHHHSAFRR
ncbi:MAG TPA: hypothetical protein VN962_28420 [Polyangia bacterium]|nr:hypothetical protein [Polyangia bacterium]